MSFRIHYGQVHPLGNDRKNLKNNKEISKKSSSFQDVLDQKINNQKEQFKISSHAQQRLSQRNIILNEGDLKALERGINQADAKGSKEALLFYKNIAFITSVKNRTIITAVDQNNSNENIFTNIDSAVIIK